MRELCIIKDDLVQFCPSGQFPIYCIEGKTPKCLKVAVSARQNSLSLVQCYEQLSSQGEVINSYIWDP